MQKLFTIALLTAWGLIGSASMSVAQESPLTEQHKVLTQDEGEWNAAMTMWIPGVPEPIKGSGSEVNRLIGGGLWVISDFTSEIGGEEFVGHGTFGYDPVAEKYVGTWVDSMTPHIATMEGTYDADSRTMTFLMEAVGPDGTKQRHKSVAVYNEDGSRTFTMYNAADTASGWAKTMEIVYTKK